MRSFRAHADFVTALAFDDEGKLLASGSLDGRVKVWSASGETLHYDFGGHTGRVAALSFGTDGGMLASASEDCERLLETLNNLLELARAESGMTSLNLAPVPLAEIARESLLLFETIAAKKGIRIDLQHNGDLPEVCADALRLREVINNLVSNAIKHSPEDGTVTIRIGRSGTDFLRLSVLDEGAGVPDGIQDRIFERFFRAEAQTHDGVGLGLFISREIMRAHEGRIGVRDRSPDEPTEFFIDVPIA